MKYLVLAAIVQLAAASAVGDANSASIAASFKSIPSACSTACLTEANVPGLTAFAAAPSSDNLPGFCSSYLWGGASATVATCFAATTSCTGVSNSALDNETAFLNNCAALVAKPATTTVAAKTTAVTTAASTTGVLYSSASGVVVGLTAILASIAMI
ncbi:hypothetical protein BCR33DRAFT_785277 [Rhizoclosmatium globosum]|uniref:Extracellular membrane protein CFEM domain-containing protein n=1 Tax=Rhizoclosmatium globosum TaxID=329046 RepID=A0A1Y2CAG2_9FUNG|nr:hypothetical protein BCR33DRAFT_785277 [Rhizoclosmatium globosum]|eukprot:ORY44022.1 hypothetical protein BCR33DRAFT_785277 [Rhizoclosmatium globosum]